MEKVSIVVPIYNTERYLKKCIDSILNQTYCNFELICINDGSTDKCDEIIKQYKDDRIIYIQQKNSGVSSARNKAISICTGEYVVFIDSDDFVEKDFVRILVDSMKEKKSQMVVCKFNNIYMNKIITVDYPIKGKISVEELKKEILKNDSIRGFLWNKIFITSIIRKNSIRFDENITMCEDLLFCIQYLQYINSAYIVDKSLYNYRQRKNSSIGKIRMQDLSLFDAYNKILEIDDSLEKYTDDIYCYWYFKYHKLLRKSKKKTKRINIFKIIFNKNISNRTKIISFCNLILPFKLFEYLRRVKHESIQFYN